MLSSELERHSLHHSDYLRSIKIQHRTLLLWDGTVPLVVVLNVARLCYGDEIATY